MPMLFSVDVLQWKKSMAMLFGYVFGVLFPPRPPLKKRLSRAALQGGLNLEQINFDFL